MSAPNTTAVAPLAPHPEAASISPATQHNSKIPFFRLPGELRNEVYTLVFRSTWCLSTIHGYAPAPTKDKKHILALTQTCRRMHREAARFAIDCMTFFFDYVQFAKKCIPRGLARAPRMLRKLAITLQLLVGLIPGDMHWGPTVQPSRGFGNLTGLTEVLNEKVLPELEWVRVGIEVECTWIGGTRGVTFHDDMIDELSRGMRARIRDAVEKAEAKWQKVNSNVVLEMMVKEGQFVVPQRRLL